MNPEINPTPEGFHTLLPGINLAEVDAVITFIKNVFEAVATDPRKKYTAGLQ